MAMFGRNPPAARSMSASLLLSGQLSGSRTVAQGSIWPVRRMAQTATTCYSHLRDRLADVLLSVRCLLNYQAFDLIGPLFVALGWVSFAPHLRVKLNGNH